MLGALIGAGISVASNAIGSAIANKRKRKAEEQYQAAIGQQMEKLDNEMDANYLDSMEAQNALRKQTNANAEALRQLNTSAIRGGATDEAKVAMASKLNQSTADLVGDLAVVGEQKKEALRAEKRAMELGQIEHSYAQNSDVSGIDTLTSSISSAAGSLGTAISDAGITGKGIGTSAKNLWNRWFGNKGNTPPTQ
jgi:F0F1-type ATP synthase membrane subunit c/vacuolar-type H+-ATPase subunit K